MDFLREVVFKIISKQLIILKRYEKKINFFYFAMQFLEYNQLNVLLNSYRWEDIIPSS